jgi:AcrR family transcriptional regulator
MNRKVENNSKYKICDVLCELGKNRPIDRITVQEIISLVGINRSTFYYHFGDVPSVIEWMISDFLGEYLQLLFDIPEGDNEALLQPDILLGQEEQICALIQRRRDWLELFFSKHHEKHFRERFWDEFEKYANIYDLTIINSTQGIRTIKRGIVYDYCLRVNFAMWFEILACWHNRKFHETSNDFIEIFDILYSGVLGFANHKP